MVECVEGDSLSVDTNSLLKVKKTKQFLFSSNDVMMKTSRGVENSRL